MNADEILEKQRKYFESGVTISPNFRIKMLKRLYKAVKAHEKDIERAIFADLGKSGYESYMCETGLVLSEIKYMIRHVRRFSKKHMVHTPLSQFAAVSFQKSVPYGNVLIMSPWNYPVLLTLEPLADALAAGNTALIKPSAYSAETGKVLQEIIGECFPAEYVTVIRGGRKENAEILSKKFDFIFFTGSGRVGKEVLRRAAENLTPAVLELGGKSPCIVDGSADIKKAAKRIVFGKFLNCGQTCVAPDYILCESGVKESLIFELKAEIKRQYGEKPLKNPDYGKIINKKHFERLLGYLNREKIVFGGETAPDILKVAPTVMDNVKFSDKVMEEEIFGPILPIVEVSSIDEAIGAVNKRAKPLALYIFSENNENIKKVTERCRFGGGCVNDTVIHLATSEMGFGGVGESGMGAYHGKVGFDAFSHKRSMVVRKTRLDLPIRYQPYRRGIYEKLLRIFLR